MIDLLFQMGLSNVCFSLILAIAAMIVGAKTRRANLVYMLWLLVFIKLVTPPLVKIPVSVMPQQHENIVSVSDDNLQEPTLDIETKTSDSLWTRTRLDVLKYAGIWLPLVWFAGSILVLIRSMLRVFKFNSLLSMDSNDAPEEVQTAAIKIASRLGLKRIPSIYTLSAQISPMVWWVGGKVRIYIPIELLNQMEYQQWQWVLAHELAHVKRRDYLVRWLEWIACVCFWWNPVVLFAQRNLRAMEEICCDELVMSSLNPKPKFYANSLLSAVEFLAQPVLRPPAIASEINSGGFLERRFKMIMANKTNKSNLRWLQACILIFAIVVLPLGISSAQDYNAVGKRLNRAVTAGEITTEQARTMLGMLRKSDTANKENVTDTNTLRTSARARQQKSTTVTTKQDKNISNRTTTGKVDAQTEANLRKVRNLLAGSKLTKVEAQALIKEIQTLSADQNNQKSNVSQDIAQARTEIRKEVAEGKLSKEEGQAKLAELRKKQAKQNAQSSGQITRQEIANTRAQLQKEVSEGKITKQQAQTRIKEMQTLLAEQNKQKSTVNQENAQARAEIQKAVKEGKLTKEEGQAKLAELRKKQTQQAKKSPEQITRQEIANTRAQLQKEVSEGKITQKQAQAKLAELRKKLTEQKSVQ